jgi:hypothetical protein
MNKAIIALLVLCIHGQSAFSQFVPDTSPPEPSKSLPQKKGLKNQLFQKFIKDATLRNLGLYQILKSRSDRYIMDNAQKHKTARALNHLLQELDFDILLLDDNYIASNNEWELGAYAFIAFKDKFKKMMELNTTHFYLESVNEYFQQYIYFDEVKFNLWDHTLKFFKGNKELAAHVIGVLFQDTSRVKLHIEYALRKFQNRSENFEKNLMILSEVINNMNFMAEMNSKLFIKTVFPVGAHINRNTSLYHFYVPLYLANRIASRGFDRKTAAISAFMLPLAYEMATGVDNFEYIFKDPPYIKSKWKVQDILQGYQGALYGVGLSIKVQSFPAIRNSFSLSAPLTIRKLVNF